MIFLYSSVLTPTALCTKRLIRRCLLVPQVIEELEASIENIKAQKKEAVKQQNFEVAAAFRDKERQQVDLLEEEKENWQKELNDNPIVVDEEHVAEVVAMMTGVPVRRIAKTEGMKLLQMHDELAGSVIGQDEAIEKIVRAIHRNRAGLKDPNRPIGSFIFLGPTGVGKTQLARYWHAICLIRSTLSFGLI